jgi:3-phytase
LTNPAAKDQDDMAFWIDQTDSSRSTVITSDKEAGKLFVYDLLGRPLQSVDLQHPGNVDVRQDVAWRDGQKSIVCVNERGPSSLAVFEVDALSRRLTRVDDQEIDTAENYGGALLYLRGDNRVFSLCTSKASGVQQIELIYTNRRRVRGNVVRHWPLGTSEGAVADDRTGQAYISVEQEGIYGINAVPGNLDEPQLVIPLGKGGLVGDAEGIALVRGDDRRSYLIVSDQGASTFRIYRRENGYAPVGSFSVDGALNSDGIATTQVPLGSIFPSGAFACHSDADGGKTVLLSDAASVWQLIDVHATPAETTCESESR